MKTNLVHLTVLSLIVVARTFAETPELTIDYDAKTALIYPERDLVSEVNHAIGEYNNEIRLPVSKERIQAEQRQMNIAELKQKVATLKDALAKERARLASAKASRVAQPFPECAQLPWGSSPQTVTDLLTKRGAKSAATTDTTKLTFRGGTLAGETVHLWECKFTGGKLAAVTVYFQRSNEGLELFREWNATLAQKYHIADIAQDLRYSGMAVDVANYSFKTRMTEANMMADQAQAMGDALTGKWRPSVGWSFADNSRIALLLASPSAVAIAYVNGPLEAENQTAHEKAKQEGTKDL
jgi:hypothetical protein